MRRRIPRSKSRAIRGTATALPAGPPAARRRRSQRPSHHCRARHRHRRLHPPTRGAVRHRRLETEIMAASPASASSPSARRSIKSAPSPKTSATRRRCCRSSADPTRATRPVCRNPCRITPRRWTAYIKGLKLGLPREYMVGGLDAEVKAAVDAAVKQFEKLGAEIVEISLPHTDYAVATITSSPPRKRRRIWRGSTAFVTARGWTAMIRLNCIPGRAGRVSARR